MFIDIYLLRLSLRGKARINLAKSQGFAEYLLTYIIKTTIVARGG